MAVVKNLNSDYTITNKIAGTANITLATHTVFIQGNLLVGGNTTSVTKTDMEITDNLIVLNKGEMGAGVTLGTAGLEVDRGSQANVQVVWNESYQRWSLTNDGSTFGNIATSSGAGGINIIDDLAPQLGGNLDVLSRNIFSSDTANIRFDNNLAIKYTTITPTTYSGYNVIYAKTPNTGGSGLYVTNTTNQPQELATQTRNIGYSIIFS
jgi:hypothetical protein